MLLVQIIAGFIIAGLFSTWNDRGTFGDMFGAVNTLFSGFAFAGVIYAIFLQGKELELQREELSMTRNELAKSATAQNEQAKLMLHSAKINATASKLDTYTNLMVNKRGVPGGEKSAVDYVDETIKELETLVSKNV